MMFSKSGKWAVVQQAMSPKSDMAVRFQWFSELVDRNDVANEPHSSIFSKTNTNSLDLTSGENGWVRESGGEALDKYDRMLKGSYPERHDIRMEIDMSKRARETIARANDIDPENYKDILLIKGVGRAMLRSLAFVSALIYEKELAYRDPVMYAYNLGGKDRIPFKINKKTYDSVCRSMNSIVEEARIENGEKYKALKRLSNSITS
jgi:hypothetical protein